MMSPRLPAAQIRPNRPPIPPPKNYHPSTHPIGAFMPILGERFDDAMGLSWGRSKRAQAAESELLTRWGNWRES